MPLGVGIKGSYTANLLKVEGGVVNNHGLIYGLSLFL